MILARNEEENLKSLIPGIREALRAITGPSEILVVDGRSADGTARVAADLGARVITQTDPGYGAAFRDGVRGARGKYVINIDADGSHDPFYIRQVYAHRHEAEIVIGSRYCYQGHYHGQRFRHLLSRILNAVFARVLSLPVRDVSSGLRLYRRDVVAPMDFAGSDFNVLEEVLVLAWSQGYRTLEIPIHFRPRQEGVSKARLVRFGISYLRMLARLWMLRNSMHSADYDDRAFHSILLPQRWWQRRRYRAVLALAEGARGRTLDAGCGSSKILAAMPHAFGLDYRLAKVRFRRITNTRLMCGDVCRLPFHDATFGLVINSQVIEHIPDTRSALDELTRVLAPGGILVIGTPDYGRFRWRLAEWLYKIVLPNAYGDDHVSRFTRASLADALVARGFAVEESRYVFGAEVILRARKSEAERRAMPPEGAAVR